MRGLATGLPQPLSFIYLIKEPPCFLLLTLHTIFVSKIAPYSLGSSALGIHPMALLPFSEYPCYSSEASVSNPKII